jgi:hypothetical protein
MTLEQALTRIAELESRLREYEKHLGFAVIFPAEMGLSARQHRMCGMFAKRGLMTNEAFFAIQYGNDPSGGPLHIKKCMEVSMYHLRRRLSKYGIKIVTRHKIGYEIVGEDLKKLRALANAETTP